MSQTSKKWKPGRSNSDAVYGIGVIGAMVYYFSHAASFGQGLLGLVKALFWPGFLVYQLLEFLKA